MGPIYSLDDVVDMLRRRAVFIAAVTFLGGLACIFIALATPHEYQATEVIQVETPLVTDNTLISIVQGSSGRRLQSVQQQVTSRSTLLDIIEQYGLFEDLPALTLSEKAQLLREAIVLEGVPAATEEEEVEAGELSVMTITVTLGTPELAQSVAREVSQRTIELYAARRVNEAKTSLQFYSDEEDKLYKELQDLGARTAEYRAGQDLGLPGAVELRRAQIDLINEALLEIEREQITTQRRLDQADDNPIRRETLEREIRDLETQLLNLDEQHALLMARLSELTVSLEVSPEVDRQLAAFERERQLIRQQLDIVSARQAEAEVAVRLETERKSERLVVLEQAVIPPYPSTPSRTRFVILGTAASVVLGIILAFILELRRPVIRTAQQMEREIGITPVVTVPHVAVSRAPIGPLDRVKAWLNGQVPITIQPDKSNKMSRS